VSVREASTRARTRSRWAGLGRTRRRPAPAAELGICAPRIRRLPQELAQLRAFAVCMRAHGIDMSDPDPTTGNMTTDAATRDQQQNDPTFQAAWAACRDKLPAEEKQQKK
jgi:hypothetical protein